VAVPKESGEGGSSATGWRKAFAARRGEHRHGNGQDHAQGLRDIPFNKLVLSHSNVLFAHRAALSITAVHEPWNRNPQRLAHADAPARAVNLDVAAASWRRPRSSLTWKLVVRRI